MHIQLIAYSLLLTLVLIFILLCQDEKLGSFWSFYDVSLYLYIWSHSGFQCIMCVYKTSSRLLYPLGRVFIYLHKLHVHLHFEETSCINFARGTTTSYSFDFEIETMQNNQYTFRHWEVNWTSSSRKHRQHCLFYKTSPLICLMEGKIWKTLWLVNESESCDIWPLW